jgi:hypothetical protein
VATSTNRGRRARLRLRTLIRWFWYFENSPVSPDEVLLRAVPNMPGYIDRKLGKWTVDPYSFEPNKKRDIDGMSFFREDFVTRKEVSRRNRHPAGAHVIRVNARVFEKFNLQIEATPIETEPAGHVIVPGLQYIDRKQLTKDQKHRREDISQKLAQAASANPIYSPPGVLPPTK